ncbi:MAG: hypothetical protein WD824_01570 [Cyclobacteriaceae bacterium]
MNSYEEELQKNPEKGESSDADGLDIKAYQEVFRALKKDPGYEISSSFAQTVVARMISKQQSKSSKDYFWFGAGIFFLAIAFLATILFIDFRFDFGFLTGMADYAGLAVFGIAFIAILNWLDKRLIREKHLQSKT